MHQGQDTATQCGRGVEGMTGVGWGGFTLQCVCWWLSGKEAPGLVLDALDA